jgi:hypothetical protein
MHQYKKVTIHNIAYYCAENMIACDPLAQAHAAEIAANKGTPPLLNAFDKSIFDEDATYLECALCADVVKLVSEAPCGHIFCGRCAPQTEGKCPKCPHLRFSMNNIKGSKFMDRHIRNLSVHCATCKWIGMQSDYANHLRASAQYKCPLCDDYVPYTHLVRDDTKLERLDILRRHIAKDFVHHLSAFTSLLIIDEEDSDESVPAASSSGAQSEQ